MIKYSLSNLERKFDNLSAHNGIEKSARASLVIPRPFESWEQFKEFDETLNDDLSVKVVNS